MDERGAASSPACTRDVRTHPACHPSPAQMPGPTASLHIVSFSYCPGTANVCLTGNSEARENESTVALEAFAPQT